MKAKKIIWGILFLTLVSCTTDDKPMLAEEQLQINAKSGSFVNPENGEDSISITDSDNPTDNDGSGTENNNLIPVKIKYLTFDIGLRNWIRADFKEKYDIIILEKAMVYEQNETWFINTLMTSGASQPTPQEDDPVWDPTQNSDHIYVKTLKDAIFESIHITLVSSQNSTDTDTLGGGNNGSSNTGNGNQDDSDHIIGDNDEIIGDAITGFQ